MSTTTHTSIKNITRFDYGRTAFEGWRLNVACKGTIFLRYFPDKKLGGPEKSLEAAKSALEQIRARVKQGRLVDGKLSDSTKDDCRAILDKHYNPSK